jgi:hypothetical protein
MVSSMSVRSRIGLFFVWLVSLAFVGILVSAQTQTRRDPAPIISGNDIGFVPEGWRGSARTGKFVVRVNGQWVDAVDTIKAQPVTTR